MSEVVRKKKAAKNISTDQKESAGGKPVGVSAARLTLWVLAVTVFAVSTFVAFRQSPFPNAYQPERSGIDWWRYPVEQNAFMRLPAIGATLAETWSLPDGKHVWAVGSGGAILASVDGGQNWMRQTSGTSETLNDIHFVDRDTGWAVGYRGAILHTSDGGQNWQAQTIDTSDNLFSVFFLDRNSGWAGGEDGTLLTTTDGGETWRDPPGSYYLNPDLDVGTLLSIYFSDRDNGWAVGWRGTIIHTSDGGQTWRHQNVRTGQNSKQQRPFPNQLPLRQKNEADLEQSPQQQQGGRELQKVPRTKEPQGEKLDYDLQNAQPKLQSIRFGFAEDPPARESRQTRPAAQQRPVDITALNSVYFTDNNTGWVTSLDGSILATTDGGQSWQAQYSETGTALRSIHFVDRNTGWAVGDKGTILHTTDGGTTWQPQQSGTLSALHSIHFVDHNTGRAVGENGTILHTTDGGKTWHDQTTIWLGPFHFFNPSIGLAVGGNDTILDTTDGGKTWRVQVSDIEIIPESIFFVYRNLGWAVGDEGAILRTTDGGQHWETQPSGTEKYLNSVHFAAYNTGWVVGEEGIILHTSDGGQTWLQQTSGTDLSLDSVYFIDRNKGWAVGSEGAILRTTDGGQSWRKQTGDPEEYLESVHFADRNTGWVVGDNGTILHTSDGGQSWLQQTSGTDLWLESVYFIDRNTGWAVGDEGAILRTTDGGQSWLQQTSGTDLDLEFVHFTDSNNGIASDEWNVLSTTDGGETWEPLRYHRYPAPWYYLTWLLVGLLGYVATQLPERLGEEAEEEESIGDLLISDRPLEPGDPDAMNLQAIALGLSRFFRNENTQPPLTVAITGKWGTGKSSLMNLVKADLEGYGFRPVWFNAWHHQQEEHLLASLLQNVKQQAIPPWWRPEAWLFRARLLLIRGWRSWVPLLTLMVLFAFFLGWEVHHLEGAKNGDFFPHLWTNVSDAVTKKEAPSLEESSEFLTTLLGLLGLVWGFYRFVPSFGVQPANLLASAAKGASLKTLDAQVGFRQRFAEQFEEVTKALAPRSMVIFVDDLDRCRPENVLDVLEAVNFLISSGECIVVMGLAKDQVEACVGLGFEKIAEEMTYLSSSEDGKDALQENSRERRAEYARQYLRKLINLEVAVPEISQEQSEALLRGKDSAPPESTPEPTPFSNFVATLANYAKYAKAAASVAVVALVLSGAYFLPGLFVPPKTEQPNVAGSSKPAGKPVARGTDRRNGNQPPPNSGDVVQTPSRTQPTGSFKEGEKPGKLRYLIVVPVGLFLLLTGYVLLILREEVVVRDSPTFSEALKIWNTIIYGQCRTPRALKRFLNHVRYLAMLQKPQKVYQTYWQQILGRALRWLGFSLLEPDTEESEAAERIPEEMLVCFAALEGYDHLSDDDNLSVTFWSQVEKDELLQKVTAEHTAKFESLQLSNYFKYKEITSGIASN